jgi:hypothetical protein
VGIVTVDVAIGVVVVVLWQALLAPFLLAVAPSGLRARLSGDSPAGLAFHFGSWQRAALVVAAVGLGALTHVVWDSFTHDWMWGPAHIPWLATRHGPLMGYEWVRWASEAVGGTIILGWVLLWWRRASQRPSPPAVGLRCRVLAWLVVVLPAAVCGAGFLVRGEVLLAIARGGGLGVVCLLGLSIMWRLTVRAG